MRVKKIEDKLTKSQEQTPLTTKPSKHLFPTTTIIA